MLRAQHPFSKHTRTSGGGVVGTWRELRSRDVLASVVHPESCRRLARVRELVADTLTHLFLKKLNGVWHRKLPMCYIEHRFQCEHVRRYHQGHHELLI